LFFMFAVGLPAGKLFDQGYFRQVITCGSALCVSDTFMLSLAIPQKYYQLVLSQSIGMGIGSDLMLVPVMFVQTQQYWWMRCSLAMGIVMTGAVIDNLIHPVMLNKLVNRGAGFAWGVRATVFLTLSLLATTNCIMTTRLPSARQRGPGPKPNMKTIMTDGPYVLVVRDRVRGPLVE
ncbi:uncharacterized protein B0H18DRAFT_869840, partial [Fomitopsis serialis]|uniref:uncharacterized protein n=1 Tax=Fomitopsis serialis TaxID=139415 RepID=UPI00200761B5